MFLEKLERLKPREKMGLALAALALFAVVVNNMIVVNISRYLGNCRREIRLQDGKAVYNTRILAKADDVNEEYNRACLHLGTALSDEEVIEDVKGEIDDLAGEAGIEIDSMEHLEPRIKQDAYKEYAVRIGKFETGMSNMLKFMDAVHRSHGMLRIVGLNINPGKDGGVAGSMLITKVMLPVRDGEESAGAQNDSE